MQLGTSNEIPRITNSIQPKRKRITTATPLDANGLPLLLKMKHQRSNWHHPLAWPPIHFAALRTNFSSRGIVKYLQHRHSQTGTYNSLTASTVNNWIDKNTNLKCRNWTAHVLKLVDVGSCWVPGNFTLFHSTIIIYFALILMLIF